MKRTQFIFGIVLTLLVTVIAFSQPAEKPKEPRKDTGERKKILIDFGKFEENLSAEDSPYPKDPPKDWETNLNDYVVTQADMGLDNWMVKFNSSSDTFINKVQSYTKKVTTKKGETVLGAKIHFPSHHYIAHAIVTPPYEIMEYNNKGKLVNIQNGVVDNVYLIKEISVEVSGRNFNNRLILRLINENRKYKSFFMGYLNFVGWRKLIWKNPEYIANVDQRRLFRVKLYPKENPYYKFDSFIITRAENGYRGDFVVYFKKVEINYDIYSTRKDDLTIDDEKTWEVKKHKAIIREAYLKKKHATMRTLRSQELARMGKNAKKPDEKKSADKKPKDKAKP